MMSDPEEVDLLRRRDIIEYGNPDGPTFQFLVERLRNAGLEGGAIFEAIVEGAYRTDLGVSRDLRL